MRLYVSGTSIFNSTVCNEAGQTIYKVRTPPSLLNRTTTILAILPNTDWRDIRDYFGYLAQFKWKSFRSSRLRYGNQETRTRTLFKKGSLGWHGRDRIFTVNNCLYKWRLGTGIPELRVHGPTQTLIARFQPGGSSCFFTSQSPHLEILPAWEHIADEILISFVYIERLRQDE